MNSFTPAEGITSTRARAEREKRLMACVLLWGDQVATMHFASNVLVSWAEHTSVQLGSSAPLVLVVDHNENERNRYMSLLGHRGYRTDHAVDGRDGINRARSTMPDIVLMARSMPRLDGVAAAKELKADPYMYVIPIIMLTGYWAPACDACFERGRSVAELHHVIQRLCARPVLARRPPRFAA
jgi:CheY-like chemotaxis protein